MKPRMIVLLTVLMLTSLPALRAICLHGKEAATLCEASIGFESFRLGGVFGRRVETMRGTRSGWIWRGSFSGSYGIPTRA